MGMYSMGREREGQKYYPNQFILARQYQIIRNFVFIEKRWFEVENG